MKILNAAHLNTPLGSMLAIADEKALYALEFAEQESLKSVLERFKKIFISEIIEKKNFIILSIEQEMQQYFKGKLKVFKTPFICIGTPFQQRVWKELQKIPYGKTKSYADIAKAIGKPTAYRAVALANGANRIGVVIPCHRVINTGGGLGGYAGGVDKKQSLLRLEMEIV